jgi:hypothetical protein
MSVVVYITGTFPTPDILATGRVTLHSLVTVAGVMLKIDKLSNQYVIEFPLSANGQPFIELCDDMLKEKVLDAMVLEYEQYIILMSMNSNWWRQPYIYELEMKRIESKNK